MASIFSDKYQLAIKTLRNARMARGMTQENLVRILDNPQSFIARVESGERRLDIMEFVRIACLLGIDPRAVVGRIAGEGSEFV